MKEKLDILRDKLKAAAAAMGLELEIGTMTYGDNKCSFSCKAFDGIDGRAEEFARVARKFGFPADWYGKTFTHDGTNYTITGGSIRGRKYPIHTSGSMKWTVATVRKALA